MRYKVIDWQLAMVCLFGSLDDVRVTIRGDGITNTYEATHLPTGIAASVHWPRDKIHTAADQEVHMIKAMEKLKEGLVRG